MSTIDHSLPRTQAFNVSPLASESTAKKNGPSYVGMGRDFIKQCKEEIDTAHENAKHLQFGKAITLLPKLLFQATRFLGNVIQGGHDFSSNKARYLLGGVLLKMPSTVADFGIELSRSVIDHTCLAVKRLFSSLIELDPDIESFKERDARKIDAYCIENNSLMRLMTATTSKDGAKKDSFGYLEGGLPREFAVATIDDLPPEIMARRKALPISTDLPPEIMARRKAQANFNGERLKLRQEATTGKGGQPPLMILRGDAWSGIRVAVFKRDRKIILCVQGTDVKRPATVRADANIFLGVRDVAQDEINELVDAFANKHGRANVQLVGHSLGGNLASDAALRHGIHAVTVNPYGLNLMQRIDQRSKIVGSQSYPQTATVTNMVTNGDPLDRLQQFLPTKVVGAKYVMDTEISSGHRAVDAANAGGTRSANMPLAKVFSADKDSEQYGD